MMKSKLYRYNYIDIYYISILILVIYVSGDGDQHQRHFCIVNTMHCVIVKKNFWKFEKSLSWYTKLFLYGSLVSS